MHCERVYFFAHPEQKLREVEWIHYGRYLSERSKGKPTQYITQKQEFFGREFRVSKDVLIPRPETELLVETVLHRRPDFGALADVGTGSGCIAVSLAMERKPAGGRVYALDISAAALKLAHENSARFFAGVQFIEGDLLNPVCDSCLDVVVSNPPYVPLGDLPGMQREVRDWEPHLALFAGNSGLAIYQRLIPEAWRVLKSGGLLALELGFGLAGEVQKLASDWSRLEVLPDLAGIPRVLVCEKP
jgi:release factor glutamine methyltransferase